MSMIGDFKLARNLAKLDAATLRLKVETALAEAMTMAQARTSNYGQAGFTERQDYTQPNYPQFHRFYYGDAVSQIQLGALFAQPIVHYHSALEIGALPKLVVSERKTGKSKVAELSLFVNQFLRDNHSVLVKGSYNKHKLGDTYYAFLPNRQVEAIAPYPANCTPIFHPYNDDIFEFTAKIKRSVVRFNSDLTDTEKEDVDVIRYFGPQEIIYKIDGDVSVSDFGTSPLVRIPNLLGRCPVLHAANNADNTTFGYPEYASCVPFMQIYHAVMARGFEAQQYMGKPILQVLGIGANVAAWLKKSFGIDVDASVDQLKTKMMEFFDKFKFFAFADDAKAEFIEAKYPIGATKELADLAFQGIVRISMVPEFMFGAAVTGSNATTREQYVGITNYVRNKQRVLGDTIRQLAKWAMFFYTAQKSDPISGRPLETYGFISDPEKLDDYIIDVIWPPVLNSDLAMMLDGIKTLLDGGAMSLQTAMENLPELVPDPVEELTRLKAENTDEELHPMPKTGDGTGGGDSPANKNRKQRKRDDPGNSGSNSGRTGTGAK